MRILHVATRHGRRGGERRLLHALDYERRRGYQVHVAFGRASDISQLPSDVEFHLIPSLVRNVQPVADMKARLELSRLLRAHRFDVVHTHHSKAGVLGRVAARGHVRTIIHTVHSPSFGPGFPWYASAVFLAAERYCARHTDLFVVVGEEVKQLYRAAGIGQDGQYFLVRSPIDIEGFAAVRQLAAEERAAARRHFSSENATQTIVTAGALEVTKRHMLLLETLAPLLVSTRVQLLIAGEGPLAGSLVARARELGVSGRVRLLSFVHDLPRLFAAADLLVHTSRVEGVPQVVIQALAAGLPVVATETQGLREVRSAPITVVHPRGDHLLDAVRMSLNSPAPQPVKLSALAQWSPAQVETQLEQFYDRLDRAVFDAAGSKDLAWSKHESRVPT